MKLILPSANSGLKNSLKSALRQRVGLLALALAALMLGGAGELLSAQAALATTGINPQINFQGRLLNATGAVVADGNYNIEFKIYQDGPGNVAGDTGGTLKWTEDWLNNAGNGVVVRNGYFSLNLGSITSLATVDFTQNTLWLSMNIGSTNGTCTPFSACTGDGEMLPMKRLTTNPYSFYSQNSGQLGGLTASQFAQLSANQTFTGTNLFQPSASAAALQVSNATGAVLTVDTSGNNVVIGKAGSVTGTLQFANATGGNVVGIQSGASSAAYTLTLPTTAPSTSQCLQTDSVTATTLKFASCSTTTLQQAYNASTSPELVLNATNGALTVRDASTSLGATANLLEVQNNAGTVTYFGVTPSGINLQDANGATMSFDNTTNTLKVYENVASPTNFASISYSGGAAIFAASSGTTQIGSGSGNVSANLTGATDIYTFGTTLTAGAAYSQNNFSVQRTVAGGANALGGALLKVLDSSTANAGVTINPTLLLINQAATGGTVSGNLIDAQLAGTSKFSVTTAGNLTTAGSLTAAGLSNCTALQTSGAGLFSCASSSSFITALGAIDGSGSPNANGATVAAGTFYLNSASASFGGVVNTTTQTFAGNKTFNGLTSFNPLSSLVNGQSGINQTVTFANTTLASNVYGLKQNITVSNTTADNSYGQNITVTDNSGGSLTNTNIGSSITLNGSNAFQIQVGQQISVSAGFGITALSNGGTGTSQSCGSINASIALGGCFDASGGVNSIGSIGRSNGGNGFGGSNYGFGSGVYGVNTGAGTVAQSFYGVTGVTKQTAAAAYNSFGVFGDVQGGTGSTVYGGYFDTNASNTATLGAALYATNQAYASTAGSGINAVNVLQAAGGAGQSTTGTTGQVAGNGAAIVLAAGNGGTAGAGSTNGSGGNITLSAGAAGAGAGTAGTAGSVIVKNASNSSTAFQVQNAAAGSIVNIDTTTNKLTLSGNLNLNQVPGPGALTLADGGAGSLPANTYWYAATFVTAAGESERGSAGSITIAASHQVSITGIPTGTAGLVTARNIYRGTSFSGPYSLVGTINDNVTTTYTDNLVTPGAQQASADNHTAGIYSGSNQILTFGGFGNNIFLGLQAGTGNIQSQNSTAMGYQALKTASNAFGNSAFGFTALSGATGNFNSAFGQSALSGASNTGTGNAAFGVQTLSANTSGSSNSAFGNNALQSNQTGASNVAVGSSALTSNTTGNFNVGIGANALHGATTGGNETAVGSGSLFSLTTGSDNTAYGNASGYYLKAITGTISSVTGNGSTATVTTASTAGLVSGIFVTISGTTNYNGSKQITVTDATHFSFTSGSVATESAGSWATADPVYNAIFGDFAGGYNSSSGYAASYNSIFGSSAGYNLQSGASANSLVGFNAGYSLTTGQNNSFLGYYSGYQDSGNFFKTGASLQNATAIGAFSQVQSSNSIILGSVDTATKVGIGTTIADNPLSVEPLDSNAGTAGTSSVSSTSVTGIGTAFSSTMVGERMIWGDGQNSTIASVASATSLTLAGAVNEANTASYRIHKAGLQVSTSGNVGIGNMAPTVALDVGPLTLQSGQIVQTRVGDLLFQSQQGAASGVSTSTSRGSNGNLTLDTGNAANGVYLSSFNASNDFLASGGGSVVVGSTNAPTAKLDVYGNTRVFTPTNSSTAFQVQNAASAPVLLVDTTNTVNFISNGSFETGTTGWAPLGAASIAQDGSATVYPLFGNKHLKIITTAASGDGVKYTIGTALSTSSSYRLSFFVKSLSSFNNIEAGYARDGSTPVACFMVPGTSYTNTNNAYTRFACNINTDATAPVAGAYIYIRLNPGSVQTFWIDGVQLENGTSATPYHDGAISLSGPINSPLQVGGAVASNNTNALFVQDNQGNTVLDVDTQNNHVLIGSQFPVNSSSTLQLSGTQLIQTTTNSTTAFQIQNSSSTPLLNFDTTNSTLAVRNVNVSRPLGSELMTAGTSLSAASGWTAISGTGQSATATHTAGNTTALTVSPAISITAGQTYRVTLTVSGLTAGFVNYGLGGASSAQFSSNGSFTGDFTATSTATLTFTPDSTFNGTITNVSVKQYSGVSPSAYTINESGGTASLEIRTNAGTGNSPNTFVGLLSGENVTDTTFGNTGFGAFALQNTTTGLINVAVGRAALQNNTTGGSNVAVGDLALQHNTTGGGNEAFGNNALQQVTTGSSNLGIGAGAGSNITTGSSNIIIGSVNAPSATASNQLQIGSYISGVTGGGNSTTAFKVQDASGSGLLMADTSNGRTIIGTMSNPGTLTVTTSTTGGTLAAATYFYKVTAFDNLGNQTGPSPEGSVTTTGTTSSNTISWTAVSGAASYRVYRGTSSGGENVYYTVYANSYLDKNSASTAGSPPASGTAYVNSISATGFSSFGNPLQVSGIQGAALISTSNADAASFLSGTNPSNTVTLLGSGVGNTSTITSAVGTFDANCACFKGLAVTPGSYNLDIGLMFNNPFNGGAGLANSGTGFRIFDGSIKFYTDTGSNYVAQLSGSNFGIGAGVSPSFPLDVQGNSTGYMARIKNSSTATVAGTPASSADGLIIDLGTANASRTTGNYFVAFAGAGTVAGKIQGGASAVAYTTTAADYSEYFKADPNNLPQPGELVSLGMDNNTVVRSASAPVGIVSTSPGFVGNGPLCADTDKNCDVNYSKYNVVVALSGQVPAKVSVANGAINVGDPITGSPVPGIGQKATGAAQIVGYALQSIDHDGTINVMIQPGFHAPDNATVMQGGDAVLNSLTVNGAMNAGSLNVGGLATLASLAVTGDATIGGNLTVTGTTTVADIVVNGHVITGGDAPKVTVLTAAGTNASVTISGNDTSGTITITTGDPATKSTPAPTAGELLQLLFSKAYGAIPHILLSASDSQSATLQVYPSGRDENGFRISVNGTPKPNTAYTFDYWIAQ